MPHKAGHVKRGQGGRPYKPKAGVTKKAPKATPKVKVTKVNQPKKTPKNGNGSKKNDRNIFGLNKEQRKTAKMVSAAAQGLAQVAGHAAGKAAGSYSTTDYSQYWGRDGDKHSANDNERDHGTNGKKKDNYNKT